MQPEKLRISLGIPTYEWYLEHKDTTKLQKRSKDISNFYNDINQLKCLDCGKAYVGQNGQKFHA